MKLFLATSCDFPREKGPIPVWENMAAQDKTRKHFLVPNAEEADCILFPDLHLHLDFELRGLRKHALWKRHAEKILVYDERDKPTLPLRGLFVSMEKTRFDPQTQRACAYYSNRPAFEPTHEREPDLLFSFVGSPSHPIRERLFELKHPRAHIERLSHSQFWDENAAREQRENFATLMARAKFSLCPRGHGTSSIRLFETLGAGRVPVVISDDWTPLPEIVEADCAIFVAQSDIGKLPEILEEAEPRFETMARNAKQVFANHYASDVHFHRMAEKCESLLGISTAFKPEFPREYYELKWEHWRFQARCKAGRVKRKLLRSN